MTKIKNKFNKYKAGIKCEWDKIRENPKKN